MRSKHFPLLGLGLTALISSNALAQDDLDRAEDSGNKNFKIGVGMETQLGIAQLGLAASGSARGVFDLGRFRFEALFGLAFVDNDQTTFGLGGRFLYVLHKSKMADLSAGLGGTLGVVSQPGDDDFRGVFELLAQIRVFLTEAVAFTGNLGIGIGFGGDDNTTLLIGGQLAAAMGLVYFF